MKAYKGFNKDMTCRGFQFEEGKTYEEKEAKLCEKGFHACEYPLDCFKYYAPNESVYHEVELEDVDGRKGDDSKCCGKRIKIGARLNIKSLVDASVQFIMEHIDKDKKQTVIGDAATNTGDCSAASNTGNYSAATNTGYCSAAEVSGKQSVAMAIGRESCAKGALGCWLVLGEWAHGDNGWYLADVQSAKVDGETVEADTWYMLQGGKFVKRNGEFKLEA